MYALSTALVDEASTMATWVGKEKESAWRAKMNAKHHGHGATRASWVVHCGATPRKAGDAKARIGGWVGCVRVRSVYTHESGRLGPSFLAALPFLAGAAEDAALELALGAMLL